MVRRSIWKGVFVEKMGTLHDPLSIFQTTAAVDKAIGPMFAEGRKIASGILSELQESLAKSDKDSSQPWTARVGGHKVLETVKKFEAKTKSAAEQEEGWKKHLDKKDGNNKSDVNTR